MKLSIIMPTFNSAACISRAIDSIIRQTFQDWELLVMDGLSKDNTLEIVQSYHDYRIKIYSESDKGIYDAMNKGVKKAEGKWLYFLGSDDWLLTETVIERVLSQEGENDVLYGDVEADCLGEEWRGTWSYQAIEYNRCHQAIFYRNSVFDKVGLYPIQYRMAADHYLNICCLLDKRITMKYLPIKIAHFSDGGFSYHYHDEVFDRDRDWIIARHGIWVLPSNQLRHHCRAALKMDPSIWHRPVLYLILVLSILKK